MNENIINERSKNYKVPDNLMEKVDNILRFSKNMTLKDSKFYEAGEDAVSKKFGDLLIKYYDAGLTNDDIIELIEFVYEYNTSVDSMLTETEENALFLKSITYGIPIVETIDPETKESYDALETNLLKLSESPIYAGSLLKMIILYALESKVTSNLDDGLKTEKNFLRVLLNEIKNWKDYVGVGNIISSSVENWSNMTINNTEDNNELILKHIGLALINKKNDIKKMEDAFREKLKILVFAEADSSNSNINKRMASSTERALADIGEPLSFFDIKLYSNVFDTTKFDKNIINEENIEEVFKMFGISYIGEQNISSNEINMNFQILYKELNINYRNILESDIIDLIASMKKDTIKRLLEKKRNSVDIDVQDAIRTTSNNIFIRDIRDKNNKITATTKLFKYRYANPYAARRASESEIIAYYIGDDYISNRYGVYSYQKLEINKFIELFKEVREYYYRVLMNESFINEGDYFAYERTFLTFLTILRFITSTLDDVRDIEMFSRNDIENFLESFGFGSLANILDTSDFINSETYAKAIIKRYIDLVKNKGSRSVIDVLEDAFTIGTGELVIYKNLLVKYVGDYEESSSSSVSTYGALDKEDFENSTDIPTDSTESTNNKRPAERGYKFVKTEYSNRNVMNTIIQPDLKNDMETFISSDKYWNIENTPTATLDDLNVNVVNTKYLIPELTIELSETYNNTREYFEFVDYIFEILGGVFNNENTPEDENGSSDAQGGESILDNVYFKSNYSSIGEVSVKDYIDSIRLLWFRYIAGINVNDDYNLSDQLEGLSTLKTFDGKYSKNFRIEPGFSKITLKEIFNNTGELDRKNTVVEALMNHFGEDSTLIDLFTFIEDDNTEKDGNQHAINISTEAKEILSSGMRSYKETDKLYPANLLVGLGNIIFLDNQYCLIIDKIEKGEDITGDLNKLKSIISLSDSDSKLSAANINNIFASAHSFIEGIQRVKTDGLAQHKLPTDINNFILGIYDHIFFHNNVHDAMYIDSIVNKVGSNSYSYNINETSDVSETYKFDILCMLDESDMNKVRTSIATLCNELTNSFLSGILMGLNLSGKDDVLIKFLKTTIEYFISYTTEIYEFVFKNSYNSNTEGLMPSDMCETHFKYSDIDSFFYDERLEISLQKED